MTTGQKQQQAGQGTPMDRDTAGSDQDQNQTFETDISETGEDGTTVRQAEVREDDLSETKPPSPDDNS